MALFVKKKKKLKCLSCYKYGFAKKILPGDKPRWQRGASVKKTDDANFALTGFDDNK